MEEHELVDGLRRRDEEAVAAFLERYRSLFYHCISHFETEVATREDLYQDLVMFVLDRLDQGRFDGSKGSFGTWLYRVAWCRCVDEKRKESAHRQPKLAAIGEEIAEQEDHAPGPDERAGIEEIGGVVRVAMTELEPEERALLDLRFVQGETLGEISRELAITVEQTKYRVRRAQVALRRVLLNLYATMEVSE